MTNGKPAASEPYESLPSLIEPFIDSPLDRVPESLRKRLESAYWPAPEYWNAHSVDQRRKQIDAFDYKENPAREVERIADWWADTLDAKAWWLTESISPVNAAILLSGRNPNTQTIEDAMRCTNLEMGPQDLALLKNMFEGASTSVTRTLKDWTEYARQRGVKVHSWIGEWEAWVSEVDARRKAADATVWETVDSTPPESMLLVDVPVTEIEAAGGKSDAPIRYDLLATRAELVAAFGVWGLNFGMFKNLTERQWLMDARKVKGRGQKSNIVEPLFCPLEVMRGLATKTRKPKFSEEKGWDVLENKFNNVFEENQQFDPRERTG